MTTTVHIIKTVTMMNEFSRFSPYQFPTTTSDDSDPTGFGFRVPSTTNDAESSFTEFSSTTRSSTRSSTRTTSSATNSATRTHTPAAQSSYSPGSGYGLTSTYKSDSNSTALGLAIGIPIGLLGVLLIAFGSWYYLKKRPSTQILPVNSEFYEASTQKNPYTNTSVSSKYSSEGGSVNEGMNASQAQNIPRQMAAKKDPPTLMNRLSSMLTPIRFKPGVKKHIQHDTSTKRFSKHGFNVEDYTISPLFLKRFNINKPFTPVTIEESPKREKELPKLPKLPSLIQMETTKEDSQFRVIKSYRKLLNDEMDIDIGEKVKLLKNHTDGWCLVKKGNETGMIPRLCLQSLG